MKRFVSVLLILSMISGLSSEALALGLDDSKGKDLTSFETDISSFTDVHKSDWFYDEIAMAYRLKLIL